MAIIVHRVYGTVTPSAGSASVALSCKNNALQNIFVKPATGTTTFDITITDQDGLIILTREDITGELNEQVQVLSDGNFTMGIANASADELFTYKIKFNEGYG